MKPKLLDLFCKQGGCSMGYHRAGFDVTGVDIKPQPKYPFPFHQADALEFLAQHGHEYDVIHASPPCQKYSGSTAQYRKAGKVYLDMVPETRLALDKVGKPYSRMYHGRLFAAMLNCAAFTSGCALFAGGGLK